MWLGMTEEGEWDCPKILDDGGGGVGLSQDPRLRKDTAQEKTIR